MAILYMSTDRDPDPDTHYWVRLWSEVSENKKLRYIPETRSSLGVAVAMWNWARSPHFTNRIGKADLLSYVNRFDPNISQTSLSRFLQTFLQYDCRKQQRIETLTGFQRCYAFLYKEELIIAAEQIFKEVYSNQNLDLTAFTDLEKCRQMLISR